MCSRRPKRCAKPAAADADVTHALTQDVFAAAMVHCLAQGASWPGAVAVSGGGDSKALMLLLAFWAKAGRREPPLVVTVDHGLSPGSEETARKVVADAKRAGLKSQVLTWKGRKPKSDVEAAARAARYRLMGEWCASRGIHALYVAHTLEDQAETFLLRLARGSGLDGLAAMRVRSSYPLPGFGELSVVRPLLGVARADLRGWLERKGEGWTEDPMNDDPRFARIRLRQSWPALAALGLEPSRIAAAAGHLERARSALERATTEFLGEASRTETGRVLLDRERFAAVAPEIGLRALAKVLSHVSGAPYRPRFERLERLYRALCAGEIATARTLHGCRIARLPKREAGVGPFTLVVTREPARRKKIVAGEQIS